MENPAADVGSLILRDLAEECPLYPSLCQTNLRRSYLNRFLVTLLKLMLVLKKYERNAKLNSDIFELE